MKYEEGAGEWGLGELVLAECGQPVDAITEFDGVAGVQYLHLRMS
jgi:hypothetical protein